MTSARDEIVVLASRQAGWVAATQLRSLDANRTAVWRLVQSGVLVVDDGLYRLTRRERSIESKIWRAVLLTDGVLSHGSAARQLGASGSWRQVEVTVPYGRTRSPRDGVIVHRTRRLPDSHVAKDEAGFPVTIAPRTLVDLCAPAQGLADERIEEAIDAWIASGRVRLNWLRWFVENEATQLPGRRRAGRLLGLYTAVDSKAERQLLRLLRRNGLPACVPQHHIRDADGAVIGRVDFAWPDRQVALELDSYRYHTAPAVFVHDRQRGNEISVSGWTLLRTTVREIEDQSATLVDALRRALLLPPSAGGAPATA